MSDISNKSSLFDKDEHLSQQALQSLKKGTLSDFELLRVSGHIGECQDCANTLADSFSSDELAEIPSGFAEEVQNKLEHNKVSNRQFYLYTMRVVVAASIALMITFSGVLNYIADINARTANIKPLDLSFVNSVNSSLQNFSEKLLNMEVYQNEKEKR